MNVERYRTLFRASCDDFFRARGFKFVKGRSAYVRKDGRRTKSVHARFLVVGGVVRVELSCALRLDEIEHCYHRVSGVPKEQSTQTPTLWASAEALSGWPLEECQRRLLSKEDVESAAIALRAFVVDHCEPFFERYDAIESVAHALNSEPRSPCALSALPGRAFRGVIAAALTNPSNWKSVAAKQREALAKVDNGFHLEQFDALMATLDREVG